MLPRAYVFGFCLPVCSDGENSFLAFPSGMQQVHSKIFLERSKGKENLNIAYFQSGPSIITWVGPKSWGWGVGWSPVYVFRMRWEHLSLDSCFVFDTIRRG